jgi:uncharacterized membrane protein
MASGWHGGCNPDCTFGEVAGIAARGSKMMILQATLGSPWWIHALAAFGLFLHVGAGIVGILSGTAAIAFRKGGQLHRIAGEVFVVAMLTMGAVGASMAVFLSQWSNVMGGSFTFYLIGSAWATVRRKDGGAGGFETAAMLAAVGTVLAALWVAWLGAHRPDGLLDGNPWQAAAVFAAIAALSATMDLRVLRRGGISGVPRLARHLWRMCLGLFIAAASFFLGQQQVMPVFIQGSPLLCIPALAPLALLIFWLVRVRTNRQFRLQAAF